jgi:hypothetical protein
MLVAIPGTVVPIRRKPKQENEFGRRPQFWHPRMCQLHRVGEKLFVDYCGQPVPVVEAQTA